MKGYNSSRLMISAGMLIVAALVSTQLMGCCTDCMMEGQVGGRWSVWNVKIPVAPDNLYAKGDGQTDDTQAIQDHIEAARNAGGGIVFFPKGKYRITRSLFLWGGVKIKGVGGATFGTEYSDALNFGDLRSRDAFVYNLSCAIVLDTGAAISTNIITTDTLLYLSGVEDISLVGSRNVSDPYDTTSNQGYGIYMRKGVTYSRSQAEFRNVLIYATKGTGFYESANHQQAFLDHVVVLACGNNGFEFNGKGNRVERAAAGGNTATGFMIRGDGGDRFYDIDAWKNQEGMQIEGCRKVSFMGLDVNDNDGPGVTIASGRNREDTAASEIEFYGGNFSGNRSWDFYLTSYSASREGPSNILINGCTFSGGLGEEMPIYDVSQNPFRNVVSNCTFKVSRYQDHKAINKNDIYLFRDCMYTGDNGRGVYANNSMQCAEVTSDMPEYQMKPYDGQVLVDSGDDTTNVWLPNMAEVQVGAVFYVTKVGGSEPVRICSHDNVAINDVRSIEILQDYDALMITRGASTWVAARMVVPPSCTAP